jgi:hypothetical protein
MENHHFLMGKSTISMAMFQSYFDITIGYKPPRFASRNPPSIHQRQSTGWTSRISTHSSADDVAEQQSTADGQAANRYCQGREETAKWRILWLVYNGKSYL